MNEDTQQPQAPTPAPVTDPNDLDTDMSEEELQSFVNQHLGVNQEPTQQPQASEEPVAPASEPETPTPPAPEPAPTPEPPTPPAPEEPLPDTVDTSDLWIETQMPDTVDANGNTVPGKTVRLGVDDDLPDDFKFKSDKHLFEVQQAISEMRQEKANRESELQTKHDERAEKETEQKAKADNNAKLDAEIGALIDIGVLEKPKVAATDPNFLQDPAVQKIDAVLKFMAADNAKRSEDGRPLLNSFGVALTAFTKSDQGQQQAQDNATKAEEARQKAEAEEVKKRGALVGGGSNGTPTTQKKVYEAGSAKSIWDVPVED
jgi:hypothetical protein